MSVKGYYMNQINKKLTKKKKPKKDLWDKLCGAGKSKTRGISENVDEIYLED